MEFTLHRGQDINGNRLFTSHLQLWNGSFWNLTLDMLHLATHKAAADAADCALSFMDRLRESGTFLSKTVVNIGANDGTSLDPVYPLFASRDCSGVCIDYEDHYRDKLKSVLPPYVDIIINKVTPDNILNMISPYKDIDVVSIDIDSFDYFILEKIVTVNPKLILIEANVEIPPGIFFARKYTEDYYPRPENRSYGCSLDAICKLGEKSGYKLIRFEWNTAFLIRDDLAPVFAPFYPLKDHYFNGYANRKGRDQVFFHQKEERYWCNLPVDEALSKIKEAYKDAMDDIILELSE